MRHIPENKISQMFGQFDFIGNLWWIIAVVIGLILAQIFSIPIHWLLFFIIPTSIISFIIVLHLKERHAIGIPRFSIFKIYLNMSKELLHLNLKMKTILFTSFISGILSSIIYFFVPISCYLNGDGLVDAALLALIYALPLLFSRHIGKIVDSKREKIYTISFLGLTIILITLIFTQNYYILFVIMFFSGAIFELISLINRNLVNKFSDRTHLGEIDSSLKGLHQLVQ
jgi:MFS family permease